MNTKNIFRTLFMAVLLLVGANSAKADETTIWTGPNNGTFSIGHEQFSNITAGNKVRFYYSSLNIYYWGYRMNSGGQAEGNLWTNWEGESWGDGAQTSNNHNSTNNNTYTELEVSSNGATQLKTHGLTFTQIENVVFSKITIVSGSTGQPTEPDGGSQSQPEIVLKDGEVLIWSGDPAVTHPGEYNLMINNNNGWVSNTDTGTKLRIYATIENANNWKLYVGTGYWGVPKFVGVNSDGNIYNNSENTHYDADEGYFELEFSNETKDQLQYNNGLGIAFYGLTINYVVYVNAEPVPTYTLTINVDGEITTQSVAAGTDLTSLLPTPTKLGYKFNGWSGLPADGKMPASDLTVTAQFKEREHVTATIASTTGFATFCSDKALDFGNVSGLKAYYATAINDDEVVFRQVRGTVAARTGLLISGETSKIYVADGTGTSYNGNLLKGVLTSTSVNSANQYVLVERNGEAKFADTAGNAATVPAGKAYLEAPSSSSRILSFSFDDGTTGISAVVTAEQQNTAVYNLQGQRVTTVGKGLYIVNGKKVMIK